MHLQAVSCKQIQAASFKLQAPSKYKAAATACSLKLVACGFFP